MNLLSTSEVAAMLRKSERFIRDEYKRLYLSGIIKVMPGAA